MTELESGFDLPLHVVRRFDGTGHQEGSSQAAGGGSRRSGHHQSFAGAGALDSFLNQWSQATFVSRRLPPHRAEVVGEAHRAEHRCS